MTFQTIGDLAGQMLLSRARVRSEQMMSRHALELATGLTADKGDALRGDFRGLSDWVRTSNSAEVREKTLSEAITRLQARQTALNAVSDLTISLADVTYLSLTTGTSADQRAVSAKARQHLDTIASHLNTRAAGHSVFGGAQTDRAAMADGAAIYASVKSAVSGAITAQDVIDGVEIWIDDVLAGYEAQAYLGSRDAAPLIRVEDGRVIASVGAANDPAIKDVVEAVVLTALAADEDLALGGGGTATLLQEAADRLRNAQPGLIQLSSSIGYAEAQASQARTQAGAERALSEQLQAKALSVDLFEAATRLQEAEQQLEKIYVLTSRNARMSLLEYLR